MKKPIIGISMNSRENFEEWFRDYYIDFIGEPEINCVIDAGGIPIALPQTSNQEIINDYLNTIDGLIITGGSDISPMLYNEDADPLCTAIDYKRDDYEAMLLSSAIELKKPIIAICRGTQLLNAVLGGTLYQDLSLDKNITIKHSMGQNGSREAHSITVKDKDSLFYKIIQEEKLYVNSLHHQTIKDLSPRLKAIAYSNDGVVEVAELKDSNQFLIATQFHPEILAGMYGSKKMLKLFESLVEEAKK